MDVGINRSSLGRQTEVENYSSVQDTYLAFIASEHDFFWLVMTSTK